jgi:hypothetical protein
MNKFIVSVVLSAIIALVSLFVAPPSKNEGTSQGSHFLKIFGISVVTIFAGLSYFISNDVNYPEIEIGEADF